MKQNAKFWIVIALVLCLVSSVGASVFQTNFGQVTYHDMTFVTQSGHELDALLAGVLHRHQHLRQLP